MPDSSFGRSSIESDHLEYLWGTILVTGEQISIEIDSDNIVDTSSGFIREQLANEIFTMAEFLLIVEVIGANFFVRFNFRINLFFLHLVK